MKNTYRFGDKLRDMKKNFGDFDPPPRGSLREFAKIPPLGGLASGRMKKVFEDAEHCDMVRESSVYEAFEIVEGE
jgi:hypothetical protein